MGDAAGISPPEPSGEVGAKDVTDIQRPEDPREKEPNMRDPVEYKEDIRADDEMLAINQKSVQLMSNADFNASHEIWKFFLKYSLDLSTSTSQELSSRKTVNIIGSYIIDDLLQLESNYKGRYRIFSVDGFSLNTGEFTEGQSAIQLTDLSPGVYFLNTPTKTIRFLKL